MSTEKLAVGTLVRLKSGGPMMTALHEEKGYVSCMWFDPNTGTYLREQFAQACLDVVSHNNSEVVWEGSFSNHAVRVLKTAGEIQVQEQVAEGVWLRIADSESLRARRIRERSV